MAGFNLVEIDSLEAFVIVDNELDPLTPARPEALPAVQVSGHMGSLAVKSPHLLNDRGEAERELQMTDICCSAHGLSILVTATKGETRHSILFDAGPEEDVWEMNAKRLRLDLAPVELVQLSHWHRDHSGGMLRAIRMINEAKVAQGQTSSRLIVDVHPDRPEYRGLAFKEKIFSLEADPTFEELAAAGSLVVRNNKAHSILDDFFLISGEIPRVTAYETGLKGSMRYDAAESSWFSDELITDERFLMCNVKGKGIVMFTGCSHAGVVNASKHAVELLQGSVPLHAVIGGFHLASSEIEQIESSIADLKRLDPAVLLPGHCTGWRAKFAIEKQMPGSLVPCTVGIRIAF